MANRPVRAYTYELCDSIIPRDVLEVLGEKPWVQQARILVFETTAKLARDRLVDLGLRHATKLPKVVHGNNLRALVDAGYGAPRSVFVVARQSWNVVQVCRNSAGYRESMMIGSIDCSSTECTKLIEDHTYGGLIAGRNDA